MRSSILLVLLLGACAGDETDPGGTPLCTQAVYDLCNEEHDCTSNVCQYFMQSNFQVCTQSCSAATPCPVDSTGVAGTCNTDGICKPAAPTTCKIVP